MGPGDYGPKSSFRYEAILLRRNVGVEGGVIDPVMRRDSKM